MSSRVVLQQLCWSLLFTSERVLFEDDETFVSFKIHWLMIY